MQLTYLFAAYSLIWLALAVFLWRMASQIKRIQRDLDQLEGN